MSVHIGSEIKKMMHQRQMSVVGLSRELGCHRTHVYRIFESSSIDSCVLARLSIILQFDFFRLYSTDIAPKLKEDKRKFITDNM